MLDELFFETSTFSEELLKFKNKYGVKVARVFRVNMKLRQALVNCVDLNQMLQNAAFDQTCNVCYSATTFKNHQQVAECIWSNFRVSMVKR